MWNLPFPQRIKTKHGEFIISLHAIKKFYKRFLQRNPNLGKEKADSVQYFYDMFVGQFEKSREKERRNSVRQMLEHNFERARYFATDQWVFVVEPDSNVILTCFAYEAAKGIYRDLTTHQV